jgi:hypothetical protein
MSLTMKHFEQRGKGLIWYVRITIPDDVRHAFDRPVIKVSMKTRDPAIAVDRGVPLIRDTMAKIERARKSGGRAGPAIRVAPGLVDPTTVQDAIAAWRDETINRSYIEHYNGVRRVYELRSPEFGEYVRTPEFLRLSNLRNKLQQQSYRDISDFDQRLVDALTSQGIKVEVGHPALTRLRHRFGAAWYAVEDAERYFAHGDFTQWEAPKAAEPVAVPVPASPSGVTAQMVAEHGSQAYQTTITVVLRRLNATTQATAKEISESETYVRRLAEFLGADHALTEVKTSDLNSFLIELRRYPANARSKEISKRMSFPEIIEKYGNDPRVPKLSNKTIRTKWFGTFNRMFSFAMDNFGLAENPVTKAMPKKRDDVKTVMREREWWDPQQLAVIFAKPLFRGATSLSGYRDKPGSLVANDHKYWLPLIALWSGMRLDEIGASLRAEVVDQGGVWFFDLRKRPLAGARRVKNRMSQRIVPIHKKLIDLGFINYVESQIEWLFPDLPHDGAEPSDTTKNFSKWFGNWKRKNGLHDPERKQDFHSFRSNFKDACRRAGIAEDVHDLLTGHAGDDNQKTSRNYKGADDPIFLSDVLNKVAIPAFPSLQGR